MPKFQEGDDVFYAPAQLWGKIKRVNHLYGDMQQYIVTVNLPADYLADESELKGNHD